jgi:hypothetical protein
MICRGRQCLIGIFNKFISFLACKGSMVREGTESVVSCTYPDAVFQGEFLSADKPFDTPQYGNRIVQRSERIYANVKSEVLQLFPYIVGETAAEHSYLVIV